MTVNWYLQYTIGSGESASHAKIYYAVRDDTERPDTKLSEHFVLDGTDSIIHNFGFGAGLRALSGVLLDNGNEYSLLVSGYHYGTIYTLYSDQGSEGDYRIWTLNKKRLQDLSRTTPVLQVDMELKPV